MTTPPPPEPPDARDPRTAARLAVEPLDEVTRARLVRSALAAADVPNEAGAGDPDRSDESDGTAGSQPNRSPRRTARFLAVAAALAVVLVIGLAVLVPRSSHDTTPTAADAPAAKAAPEVTPGAAQSPSSDSSGTSPAARPLTALGPLGDLGDVSTPARLRAAVSAALATPVPGPTVPPGTRLLCALAAAIGDGTPAYVATGSVAGAPATVIVLDRPDGGRNAVAVVDRTCEAGPVVRIP